MDRMRKYVVSILLGVTALLMVVVFTGQIFLAEAQDDELDLDTSASNNNPQAVLAPVGTGFSYQGWLQDGSSPANGLYDFQFKLFDAATSGTQVGATVIRNDLAVTAGVFSTSLDFGLSAFSDSEARWLEIAVRPGTSTGSYTTLSPRTSLQANPYASVSGRVVSRDHTSGVAIYNPADNRAAISFGWTGNMARIRIGGEGGVASGAQNGLDIQTTGAESILRVTHDGDVYPGNEFRIFGSDNSVRTRIGLSNDAGWMVLRGPNGNDNIYMGPASNNTNHGQIAVRDSSGTSQAWMRVGADGTGEVRSGIVEITGGADLAEPFVINSVEKVEPGMVVVLDPSNPGQLRLANQAYDPLVAGVVSGAGGINPGIIMHQEDRQIEGETHPVALVGQVYVQAIGPIKVGDLLTSSDIPGYAMVATDRERAFGAIIGKAMSNLDEGTGLVLILVSLQ